MSPKEKIMTMKAAQLKKYSKSYEVDVVDVPIPTFDDNEVLVKVKAAAVNPLELLIISGSVKLIQDYSKPFILGNEVSGEIVKIGKNVDEYKVGDKVYSRLPLNKIGGLAEYVAIHADAIAPLPSNLDYLHGAAVALGGLTAYQAVTEKLIAKPGETILITGASGSFGQIAVPVAKSLGLNVIATGNSAGKKKALEEGASRYFDYTKENYWDSLESVDYVIDTVGEREFSNELKVLKKGGKLLSLILGPNKRFAEDIGFTGIKKFLFSQVGKKLDKKAAEKGIEYHFIFVRSDGNQLKKISKIVEENNIIPVIHSEIFSIDQINQALSLVAQGGATGKVIVEFK